MAKRKRKWKGTPAQRAALKKGQAALARWRKAQGNPKGKGKRTKKFKRCKRKVAKKLQRKTKRQLARRSPGRTRIKGVPKKKMVRRAASNICAKAVFHGGTRRRRNPDLSPDARELQAWGEHFRGKYPHKFQSYIDNIARKIKRDVYDHEKAPKLWEYWYQQVRQDYAKEHGYKFPVSVVREAAAWGADHYLPEGRRAAMHLIKKKTRKRNPHGFQIKRGVAYFDGAAFTRDPKRAAEYGTKQAARRIAQKVANELGQQVAVVRYGG